jgi:UMF1 family MFS transporter
MPLNDRRVITGWAFFDWANSAYYLVISTTVFPIYFMSVSPPEVSVGSLALSSASLYSFSVSAAYILIALLTPVLSGIADYSGRRMHFLRLFTLIGAAGCAGLFFFHSADTVWIGTAAFMLGTVGAAGGLVFYDSYLPLIASEDRYDAVSAKGYAYGYIGSVLLLLGCLVLIQKPEWFGIVHPTLPSRIAFVLVGLWWIGFSQITFRRLPKDGPRKTEARMFTKGWQELAKVWTQVRHDVHVKRFLTAYFFYIAGVHAVIYLATLFADTVLGFETAELIFTILLLQLVAVPGALLFARVSGWYGNKTSLLIQLGIWVLICVGAYLTEAKWQFFTIAGLVGMVLGGIQSLSRSSYAKLLEGNHRDPTSFFSFMDVLSKLAIVSGTFIFGLVNAITGNMRLSVLALATFFITGMIVMAFVSPRRINTVPRTNTPDPSR